MINKIKSRFVSKDNKRLLSNFFSLSVLQGANFILPLITIPYLVRVLGIEYFGLLAFASATIAFFCIITDYGFNLSATRDISAHRDNKEKVVEIFSSVMIIKVLLMFLSLILLIILVFSFEKFAKDWLIYFLSFGTVIGQVLFPDWFFQGMERMKYITYLNILAKSIFTVAIFIFIQEPSDFYIVPILTSIGFIIAGIWSLVLVRKEFDIRFELQAVKVVKHYFSDSWYIFLSNFGVNLYKNNVIIILGLFTSNSIVGYFSITKKIIDALNSIAKVISRTIFPYINNKYKEVNKLLISFLFKIGFIILIYTSCIFLCILLFANNISILASGEIHEEVVNSLKIMSIVPLIIALNIPAVHILLLSKRDKYFAKSVLLGAIIDLVLLFILLPIYGYIGASIVVLMTELFVTLLLYYYSLKLIKRKI